MTTSGREPRPAGDAERPTIFFKPSEITLLLQRVPTEGSPPSNDPEEVNAAVRSIFKQAEVPIHEERSFARAHQPGDRAPVFLSGDGGFVFQTVNLATWIDGSGSDHPPMEPSLQAVVGAFQKLASAGRQVGGAGNYILVSVSPNWLVAPYTGHWGF